MKANEFIKKYGIEHAKHILTDDAPLVMDLNYTDLKRLVECHELVEEYGGLDKAKEQSERFKLNTCIKMHGFMCRIIADVESCK